jgi:hypothetical protein
MMEGSEKYRILSRSWVYKWHKRFSEGICDIEGAEKPGRPQGHEGRCGPKNLSLIFVFYFFHE